MLRRPPRSAITYTDCVAINNFHDAEKAIGTPTVFCASGSDDLRFIDCMAFDDADGGWDLKAENVTLGGCVAVQRRNYRFLGRQHEVDSSV